MTELEKIVYAKSFIDKMANGINPLDDTRIPDDDLINNVRLSRCFFYVSEVLQRAIEAEINLQKKRKPTRVPFSITPEQLENFVYSEEPISTSTIARKLNWLVDDVYEKKMYPITYQRITQWLININMIECRETDGGRWERLPTAEGEEIGLVLRFWERYGKKSPVIFFTEPAQRFIIDNIEAVIATEVLKKEKRPRKQKLKEEESEEQ